MTKYFKTDIIIYMTNNFQLKKFNSYIYIFIMLFLIQYQVQLLVH